MMIKGKRAMPGAQVRINRFDRSVIRVRKSVYVTITMLGCVLVAVGSSGQAVAAPIQRPAAKYIGVDAYSNPTWSQVRTPGSKYYLGSARSEKFFYNNEHLPPSDAAPTSNGHRKGCGARRPKGTYVYPKKILCIIVWNTASSPGGSDLQSFLKSTVHDPHQIIMAFCNEPENGTTDHGCVCDHRGTMKPCATPTTLPSAAASSFKKQFEIESNYIRKFEKRHGKSNVRVGEVSWADHYSGSTSDCSYVVPSRYASYYLADLYEGRQSSRTGPITQAESLGQDPHWRHWVSCTQASHVARGIAEFAINCGNEKAHQKAVANSYTEDDKYLKAHFPNLVVWNLWDTAPGCAIDTTSEPDAVRAWRNIEAGR